MTWLFASTDIQATPQTKFSQLCIEHESAMGDHRGVPLRRDYLVIGPDQSDRAAAHLVPDIQVKGVKGADRPVIQVLCICHVRDCDLLLRRAA